MNPGSLVLMLCSFSRLLGRWGQKGAMGTWRLLAEGLDPEPGRRQRSEAEAEAEAEGGLSTGEHACREQGKGAGGGEGRAWGMVSSSPLTRMGPSGARWSLRGEMGGVNTDVSIRDGAHAVRTPGTLGDPPIHLLLRGKEAGVGRG